MDTSYFFEMVGMTGSVIMCVSAVPQIIRTYRTKCIDGLSGSYLMALLIGMVCILIYALHIKDVVFIIGNSLALLLTVILMGLWFRYQR